MEFSRQEHCSGLPFPSPGHPPNPGVEPGSPALQGDSLPAESPGKSKKLSPSLLTESESEVTQLCPTLGDPFRLLCPQDFPSKDTGVGCHFLLQGIFLTQGSDSGLPH